MSDALARRYDQSLEPVPDKPEMVRARRPSLRGAEVLDALGRMDAHDNAETFLDASAIKVYHHAPSEEQQRLIGRLEAFVSAFVGRDVKAPALADARVQERLAWLRMTPEEQDAALGARAERISVEKLGLSPSASRAKRD